MEKTNEYANFVRSVLLWDKLKKDYYKGDVLISMDLRFAQRFLTSTSGLVLLWGLANIIVIPIIIAIVASISLGMGLGIIYSIIFVLVDFYILGRSSVDLEKTFHLLMTLTGIVFVFLVASLESEIFMPLSWSLIACWLCYFYYLYIGRAIIKQYLFKDYNIFLYFVENLIVRITTKEGQEIKFIIEDK